MKSDFIFVSTALPRKCGIATYTHCLTKGFNPLSNEVGSVRTAPIDQDIGPYGYHFGVDPDLLINQNDEHSWIYAGAKMRNRAVETGGAPVIVFEHEHGIDAKNGKGFSSLAKKLHNEEELKERGLVSIAQLHTLIRQPSQEQRQQICELAQHCDLVTVMTRKGRERLEQNYGFDSSMMEKVRVVEHGVRPFDPLVLNREEARKKLGFNEDLFLFLVTGYRGEGKGNDSIVHAYGKHLKTLSKGERERTALAIVGVYHPWYKTPDGRPFLQRDSEKIEKSLKKTNLKKESAETTALEDIGPILKKKRVVIARVYPNEEELPYLLSAADVNVVGNRDRDQISSGGLMEAVSHGATIATRTECCIEIAKPIYPNAVKSDFPRRTLGENAMLIDLEGRLIRNPKTILPRPSVEQYTYCMNVLQENADLRKQLGRNGIFNIGGPFNWNAIAKKLMYCIEEERQRRRSA
ncbi:MAG: hypothetical protein KJ600_05060 [Nanoarchaeota archaeon]|nr:hypothetical protein [Nanoarchaeota archaeon]MBU1103900.1 hypothetical protein [Nanoarchaeota archaeon]